MAFTVLLVLACSSGPFFATPTPALLHFENELVAFDYLEGMDLFTSADASFRCVPDFLLGGDLVAGLGSLKDADSGFYLRSIRIFRQPMPSGSDLETVMQEAYQRVDPNNWRKTGLLDATGPVTVAGLAAYQSTYRLFIGEPAYELRDVWIPAQDALFIVSIWTMYTNPEAFAAFQAKADLLLNSLVIK